MKRVATPLVVGFAANGLLASNGDHNHGYNLIAGWIAGMVIASLVDNLLIARPAAESAPMMVSTGFQY
jgi:hypothetical protein